MHQLILHRNINYLFEFFFSTSHFQENNEIAPAIHNSNSFHTVLTNNQCGLETTIAAVTNVKNPFKLRQSECKTFVNICTNLILFCNITEIVLIFYIDVFGPKLHTKFKFRTGQSVSCNGEWISMRVQFYALLAIDQHLTLEIVLVKVCSKVLCQFKEYAT